MIRLEERLVTSFGGREGRWGGIGEEKEETYLETKLYASPGGGASMMITETSQCSKRPTKGALRGLLEARRREKGKMPSRPIS